MYTYRSLYTFEDLSSLATLNPDKDLFYTFANPCTHTQISVRIYKSDYTHTQLEIHICETDYTHIDRDTHALHCRLRYTFANSKVTIVPPYLCLVI